MEEKFLEKFLSKHNIMNLRNNREIITQLYSIDPSPSKKYLLWLFKRYVSEFGLNRPFDSDFWNEIHDALVKLEKYPDRFKNANLSTDIFSYEDTDDFIVASEKAFLRLSKKIELKNDIDLVDEFEGIIILHPSTIDASCYYGKGTRWCITDETSYIDYMGSGNLFFILNRSSNRADYKSAIYIDFFNKIKAFDSSDTKLKVSFGDISDIRYDDYSYEIIYPNRVRESIVGYLKKLPPKPNQYKALIFKNWVKTLKNGDRYKIEMTINVDDLPVFTLSNYNAYKYSEIVGSFLVLDKTELMDLDKEELIYDLTSSKANELIKVLGEEKILEYFDLDGIFQNMLENSSYFPFYKDYDLENDEKFINHPWEITMTPDLIKLKEKFKQDPVKFYNDNIFKNSDKPKYTNYLGVGGMLYYLANKNTFNYEKFFNDYAEYVVDSLAKPYVMDYNGVQYYIINYSDENIVLNNE